jgi:hypothetical protein
MLSFLISSRVIALVPKSRRKGVKPVALDSGIMRPDHFRQFIRPLAFFLIEQALLDSRKYQVVCSLNSPIRLWVVY